MKTKTLHLGKKSMVVKIVHGTVTSNRQWSETHVSSHGGGGYVGKYGGYVSAPTITSEVENHREIWVKDEDGLDVSVTLPGYVAVADGHKVRFILVEYDGRKMVPYFSNLNSQKYWDLINMFSFLKEWYRPSMFPEFFLKVAIGGALCLYLILPVNGEVQDLRDKVSDIASEEQELRNQMRRLTVASQKKIQSEFDTEIRLLDKKRKAASHPLYDIEKKLKTYEKYSLWFMGLVTIWAIFGLIRRSDKAANERRTFKTEYDTFVQG